MLSVHEVTTAYQGLVAISSVVDRDREGRDRLRRRRQRRRKIDAAEIHCGCRAAALRHRHLRRQPHRRHGAASDHRARHRLCAGKPPAVSAPVGARQSSARQLSLSRRGRPRGAARSRVQAVPALVGAARAARRDAVRRRAADAGDRPRADDAPAALDAGRALAGHHAKTGRRDLSGRQTHPRRRDDRA